MSVMNSLISTNVVDTYINDNGKTIWKDNYTKITNFSSIINEYPLIEKPSVSSETKIFTFEIPSSDRHTVGNLISHIDLRYTTDCSYCNNDVFSCRFLFPGKPKMVCTNTFFKVLSILMRNSIFDNRLYGIRPNIYVKKAWIQLNSTIIQTIFYEDILLRSGKNIEDNYKTRCTVTGNVINETCITLPFFFCKNTETALPTVRLLFMHNITIGVELYVGHSKLHNPKLNIKSIYVDSDERLNISGCVEDRVISGSEITIDELSSTQFVGIQSTAGVLWPVRLTFNFPCEYLIFVLEDNVNYITDIQSVCLKTNGHPRFFGSGRDFLIEYPQRHGFPLFTDNFGIKSPKHFVIPFGESPLNKKNNVSTGTLNLSRIDFLVLEIKFYPKFKPNGNVKITLINRHLNVLHINVNGSTLKFIP